MCCFGKEFHTKEQIAEAMRLHIEREVAQFFGK